MKVKDIRQGDFVTFATVDDMGRDVSYVACVLEIGMEIDVTKPRQEILRTGVTSLTLSIMPNPAMPTGGKRRLVAHGLDAGEADYPELAIYVLNAQAPDASTKEK